MVTVPLILLKEMFRATAGGLVSLQIGQALHRHAHLDVFSTHAHMDGPVTCCRTRLAKEMFSKSATLHCPEI